MIQPTIEASRFASPGPSLGERALELLTGAPGLVVAGTALLAMSVAWTLVRLRVRHDRPEARAARRIERAAGLDGRDRRMLSRLVRAAGMRDVPLTALLVSRGCFDAALAAGVNDRTVAPDRGRLLALRRRLYDEPALAPAPVRPARAA